MWQRDLGGRLPGSWYRLAGVSLAFGLTVLTMASCSLIEVMLTEAFLFVILGATDKRSSAIIAPIAIGPA